MRRYGWLLGLVLSVAPAFGQSQQQLDDEAILRELGMGGTFAAGNLALRDALRGNDPVQQLKRFFAEVKLPMTSAQERKLDAVVDAQMESLRASQTEEAVRRANFEYTKKLNETLTADQQTALRRYRTEQVMMRGGFPALRLILENAQAPFTPEQEKQTQSLYIEFNQQIDKLPHDAKGAPDRILLDKLENDALGKVVRLLSPTQRRALAASRQAVPHSR